MASTLPNMKKVPYNFKHFSETATIKCLKREREKGEHSGGVATNSGLPKMDRFGSFIC